MNITNAVLDRKYLPKATVGTFELFDDEGCKRWECVTLELPWRNNQRQISCIPAGKYKVVPRYSKKYGNHFHILEVPGRTYILFHVGNFTRDILGCILPGKKVVDLDGDGIPDVSSSRVVMNQLLKLAPDGFELEIKPEAPMV